LNSETKLIGHVKYILDTTEPIHGMDPDFCVIECDLVNDAYVGTSTVNPIHRFSGPEFPKRIQKSGGITGVTWGQVISTITLFEQILTAPKSNVVSVSFANDSCSFVKNSSQFDGAGTRKYLLIFDQSNKFAMPGDSGGLCWYECGEEIVALGMVVAMLEDRLFLVLPFEHIQSMCSCHDIHYSVPGF